MKSDDTKDILFNTLFKFKLKTDLKITKNKNTDEDTSFFRNRKIC